MKPFHYFLKSNRKGRTKKERTKNKKEKETKKRTERETYFSGTQFVSVFLEVRQKRENKGREKERENKEREEARESEIKETYLFGTPSQGHRLKLFLYFLKSDSNTQMNINILPSQFFLGKIRKNSRAKKQKTPKPKKQKTLKQKKQRIPKKSTKKSQKKSKKRHKNHKTGSQKTNTTIRKNTKNKTKHHIRIEQLEASGIKLKILTPDSQAPKQFLYKKGCLNFARLLK